MKIKFAGVEVETDEADWKIQRKLPSHSRNVILKTRLPEHVYYTENYPTQAQAEERLLNILTEIRKGTQ